MRREMITVPAWLAFAAYAAHTGHNWATAVCIAIAAFDTLTGRT